MSDLSFKKKAEKDEPTKVLKGTHSFLWIILLLIAASIGLALCGYGVGLVYKFYALSSPEKMNTDQIYNLILVVVGLILILKIFWDYYKITVED